MGDGFFPCQHLGLERGGPVFLPVGEVGLFSRVLSEVIQLRAGAVRLAIKLPRPFQHRQRRRFVIRRPEDLELPLPENGLASFAPGAGQHLRHAFAIGKMTRGQLDPRQIGQCREEVHRAPRGIDDPSCGNVPGPADEARHPHPALVDTALAAAERSGGTDPGIGGFPARHELVFRSVVAGKNDDCVLGQPRFVEIREQLSQSRIERGHRGAIDLHLSGQIGRFTEVGPHPRLKVVCLRFNLADRPQFLRGWLEQGMGSQGPEVEEEGGVIVLVLLEIFDGVLHDPMT